MNGTKLIITSFKNTKRGMESKLDKVQGLLFSLSEFT